MVVLIDGGTGQELRKRSPDPAHPLWSARVLASHPELVEAVHRDFLDAGATVLTLSSYAATPERLAAHGEEDSFEALQAHAVERARRARGDRDVRLAGCVPPLVASYHPELAPPEADARRSYARIVAAQAEAVDLFICETLSSVAEARLAIEAARASGRPVWAAFTLADEPVPESPRLRSGQPLEAGVRVAAELGVQAILLNCSKPEAIEAALPELARAHPEVGAYANGFTSVTALGPDRTVEVLERRADLDPEAYAARALGWVDAGAQIVGGCCEVGPEHIAAVRRALDEREASMSPVAR